MTNDNHESDKNVERYDPLLIRCPRLGGEVTFAYCRVEGGDLPCSRIVACWQLCMPIRDLLREWLTPDQLAAFLGEKPKDKKTKLVELIEVAKKDSRA